MFVLSVGAVRITTESLWQSSRGWSFEYYKNVPQRSEDSRSDAVTPVLRPGRHRLAAVTGGSVISLPLKNQDPRQGHADRPLIRSVFIIEQPFNVLGD
jgi:hypothetical protein